MASLTDKNAVIARLQSEWGYPTRGAELVADKLASLSGPLKELALRWWETGAPITEEFHGYTMTSLKEKHGLSEVAAVLTLDFLIRDPDNARKQIAQGQK